MSDDPTTATPLPGGRGLPEYGRVGPPDPHADPVTQPGMRSPSAAEIEGPPTDPALGPVSADAPTVLTPHPHHQPVIARTRTGGLWTGLILSAVVLVFLLVFIVQNLDPVTIQFLGFAGSLPLGVALLLAAVAGLLLVAIPGGMRILQLRRVARRSGSR